MRRVTTSSAYAELHGWPVRIGVCVRPSNRSTKRGDSECRSRNPKRGHKFCSGYEDEWRWHLHFCVAAARKLCNECTERTVPDRFGHWYDAPRSRLIVTEFRTSDWIIGGV